MNSGLIESELNKWDNRVIYNVKFKEDTKANLKRLDDIIMRALSQFTLIAANSEALVYKIGRYMISKGTKNEHITFIDGQIVKSYIGDESTPEWKRKDRVDEFFEIFGDECVEKWVVMPNLRFEIDIGLAIYFISKFRKIRAAGILFYAEGPNNLSEVLICNTEMGGLYQFPKADYYSKRKRELPEDEW